MKFEQVSKYPDAVIPTRATIGSAGYDFTVAEDTACPAHKVTYVPTGIKMQIDAGYYLQLALRSSAPKKFGVMMANSIGIIDSDYYNNPDNEGHIMFALIPIGDEDVLLGKGTKIGQGTIMRYGLVDDDTTTELRTGGFGSTDLSDTFSHLIFNLDATDLKDVFEE